MIPKKSNKKDELNYEVPPISEYFWKISIPLVNYYPHLVCLYELYLSEGKVIQIKSLIQIKAKSFFQQ